LRSETRPEAVFGGVLVLANPALKDGLQHGAIGFVGVVPIETDHAPLDAPQNSDNAGIGDNRIDYGGVLLARVLNSRVDHRRAGDTVAARNIRETRGAEADLAHTVIAADRIVS